jgi:hypothetical protein
MAGQVMVNDGNTIWSCDPRTNEVTKMDMSIEYRAIKFNTGIPDSEFRFKIPAGANHCQKEMTLDEAKKQANFTILSPSYLPAGFTFKSATVMKLDRIEMVSLLYMDGSKTFSINEKLKEDTPSVDMDGVEKVSINGAEGKLISLTTGGKLLTWSSAKLDFKMSSELSREETIKVAVSMK